MMTQVRKYRLGITTTLILSCVTTFIPQHAQAQQLVVDVNVFGFNSNQENASQQLAGACTAVADDTSEAAMDLLNTCQLIDDLDQNNPDDVVRLQEILNTFAPEEAFSVNDSIVYVSDYQTTNVLSRINSLRRSPPTTDADSDSSESYWQSGSSSTLAFLGKDSATEQRATGGGAAAVGPLSRVGLFFSGQFSSGDVDGSTYEQDADISSNSFTTVADYRLTDSIVAGIGFGVLQNETTFSNVDGGTDSEGFNLTAFGSWYKESAGYIDVVLDFGTNSHDLERGIGNDPSAPVLAQSSTDSSAFSFSIGAGRYFSISNWDLGGYLRLSLTNGTIDGYTEEASNNNDGSGSVFSLDSQKAESTTMVIGVEASRVISTSKAILIPVLRIEYESENEDRKDDLTATLVTSQISTSYRGTERDTAYTNLGLGGSAVFKNGKSAYAFYETHLQHDFVTQNWIKFGLRLEFQ
ncbi:autotransporter outer membrane beta-barrel domain-containing protein [Granulosicoccus antarcticus]|nr:autotransporter outer membrane beta-barrel domain-containing protein [Granulosicoccus antarcticus]